MAEDFKILLGVELKPDASSSLNSQVKALRLDGIQVTIDDSTFNTQLSSLRSQINSIRTTPIRLTMNDRTVLSQLANIRRQITALSGIRITLGGGRTGGGIGHTTDALQRATRDVANLYSQIRSMELKLSKLTMSGADAGNITQYTAQLDQLRLTYQQLTYALSSQTVDFNYVFDNIDRSRTAITQLSSEVDNARTRLASDIKINIDNGTLLNQIEAIEQSFRGLNTTNVNVTNGLAELRRLLGAMDASDDIESVTSDYQNFQQTLKTTTNQVKELQRVQQDQQRHQREINSNTRLGYQKNNLASEMDVWLKNHSAAAKQFGGEIDALKVRLASCDSIQLEGIRSEFIDLKRRAELAGKAALSLGDQLKKSFTRLSTYFSAYTIFSYVSRATRSMYDNVIELDTAMTDLMKVTDETDASYQKFLNNAGQKAQELGRSVSSFVQQSANWAKMGFDTVESSELAKISSIYANVADVDDATAVSDIVTAMKAFNIEAENAISIIDPMNKISNEFAVTAAGLGQGLSRSASTMATAGTDLEHTLALLTGISEITQSPEEAGNFLKTAVARIQGMKGELEELGEEVDESVDSISKVQTQILNLTHGKVNIFDDNEEFRDYYYIMQDIASIVDELESTERAQLYEILFGKNRMNQGAAMIQAFQSGQIGKALDAALQSDGSAYAEQKKWMESLKAKLGQLEAAWESLSNTFLKSDFLKGLIEGITSFVSLLDGSIEKIHTIPTILSTLAGAMSLFKNQGIFTFDSRSISIFNSGLSQLTGTYKKITTGINTYNSNLSRSIGLQNAYINAVGKQNSSLGTYLSSLSGAQASLSGYISNLVIAKVCTIALRIATVALNAALTMGVSFIVTELISGLISWINREEELAEKIEEVTSAYNNQKKTLQDNKSTIDDLKSEYEELSKGVDDLGRNVSLTDDEFDRYNEVAGQIAEICPTLIQGYNDLGVAILSCKDDTKELTAAMNEQIIAANNLLLGEAGKIFDGFKNAQEEFEKSNFKGNELTNDSKESLKNILNSEDLDAAINEYARTGSTAMVQIVQALKDAGLEQKEGSFWNAYLDAESGHDFIKRCVQENKTVVESIVGNFDKQIEEKTKNVRSIAEAYIGNALLSPDSVYSDISTSMYGVINSIVSQMDYDLISEFDSLSELYDYLETMLNEFKSLNKEDSQAIEIYLDVKAKFNNNECSVSDYISSINQVKSAIANLDEETKKSIMVSLGLEGAEEIISQRDLLIDNLINRGISEEIATQFADSLNVNDFSFAVDFSTNFSKEDIEAEFAKLQEGGSVNLALRPTIDASVLEDAGWENAGKGAATVFSSTFSNEAEDIAMNFTPIIADENGNYIGVLSPDELQTYAEAVIAGTRNDDLNLQIGATFEGKNAISEAESAAEQIHQLQELYYTDFSNFTTEDLYEFFVQYKRILSGINSEPIDISNILNEDAFKQIDEYKEQVEAIYEALAKLQRGESLTFDEQSNLIAMFPDLAGKTSDINTLTIALQELLNTIYFNDGTSDLDKLFNGWVEGAGGAATEAGQQILAFKDIVIGSFKELGTSQITSFDSLVKNEGFNEQVDSYVEKVSSLKEALTSLQSGDFADSDLHELLKQFPELKGHTEDLDTAILELLETTNTNMISKFAEQFGELDTEEDKAALRSFMESVLELGEVVGNTQFSIDIDVETGNMQSLYDAINESASGTGLSKDSIKNIESMYSDLEGYDPTTLFEKTENGIHLNAKALRNLQSEYETFKKNGIIDTLQDLKQEYNDVQYELENLDDTAADFEQRKLELEFKSLGIEDRIQELQTLQAQFEGLTSAYNKWLEAQSTTDEDDMYNKLSKGLEGGKELFESGRIGTDDFRQFVQMMTDEDLSNASVEKLLDVYKQGMPLMEKFFTGNSDGLLNFLNMGKNVSEQLGKEWIKLSENGEWTIDFGVGGDGEIAKAISDMTGLAMSTEQVQILLRALSAYGFDINLDAAYASLDTLKSNVEGTEEYVRSFGEEPVKIDIYCDVNKDTLEEKLAAIDTEIKNAQGYINELKNTDLTIEANAAKLADAEAKLDVLIKKKLELENPTFMHVEVSEVDDTGLQEALTLLQNYQTAVNHVKELEIKGADTSEIETAKQKVDEYANSINALPDDVKTQLGIDAEDTETLKSQIAGIEAEVFVKPVVKDSSGVEGAVDGDASTVTIEAKLGDSFDSVGAYVSALNNHVSTITIDAETGEGFDTIGQMVSGINQHVSTITIDAKMGESFNSIGQSIASIDQTVKTITIDAKTGEGFNTIGEKLSGISQHTSTITIDAELGDSFNNVGSSIASISDTTETVTIEAQLGDSFNAVGQSIASISDTTETITIEGTLGQSFISISQGLSTFTSTPQTVTVEGKLGSSFKSIASALDKMENSVEIDVEVEVDGQEELDTMVETVENLETDNSYKYEFTASVEGQESIDKLAESHQQIPETTTKTVTAIAVGQEKVDDLRESISGVNDKTVEIRANTFGLEGVRALARAIGEVESKEVTIEAKVEKKSEVNGTSNYRGTAHANGTAGRAYQQGDWGIKGSGTALGGELGQEIVVRDGRFFTIGDNGAEFFDYRQGDIIFNHKQTEELFKYGKVTSNDGRGRMFANGTAFAEGTAFSKGSGTIYVSGKVKTKSSSKNKKEAAQKTEKDTQEDEFEETFDWIEVAINRIEQAIDNLDLKANSIYRSWSSRNKALKNEIAEITGEIEVQQKGYKRYMEEAKNVGLDESWAELVRNGAIDINTVYDEELAEKIKEYQEWYEKALDCKYAVDELKESLSELYQQAFDNIVTQYEGFLSVIEHERSMLEEYISQTETSGQIISTKYYEALINVEKENIKKLEAEKEALLTSLEDAVNSGTIKPDSEAWYFYNAPLSGDRQRYSI